MLWANLAPGAGQGAIAKTNFIQFIFALEKCTLAHGAMQNCAKWTSVRAVTLLLKRNLGSLKEVWSQKMPAQNWGHTWLLDGSHCCHSQVRVTFSGEQEPWGRTSGKGSSAVFPCALLREPEQGHLVLGEGVGQMALKPTWNMCKLSKILKHFGLNYSLVEVCWCLWSYTLDESGSLAWEMNTAWL